MPSPRPVDEAVRVALPGVGGDRDRVGAPARDPGRGYLPREVFFGRLGLAGVFFSLWATDFGRFFPATGRLLPVIG